MKKKSMKVSKTNWEKLRTMNDKEIDYSDIPELTDAATSKMDFMSINDFFKTINAADVVKVDVHIRLDKEIVDFFKSQGRKYQTKINNLLSAYVKHVKSAH